MKPLFIIFYLMIGKMEQSGPLYNIHIDTNNPYDWVYDACEGEVYQWLDTGVFKYDDNLCECGELEFFNATDDQGE